MDLLSMDGLWLGMVTGLDVAGWGGSDGMVMRGVKVQSIEGHLLLAI